jgi:hypothetical protein
MPVFDVIIGLALAIMALALISIWRRERLDGPPKSRAWRCVYRALTMVLVLLAMWLLVGAFVLPRPR